MKRSRFTEEQISYALRQAESGTPVADVCGGVSCATSTPGWSGVVADLTLD